MHTQLCFWWGRAQQAAAYYIIWKCSMQNRSSKSLHLRSSTSISEMSENHGTDEAMDNSRPHSNSTSKPEEDIYQTSATVSHTLKAETGSNEAMHNSSSRCTSDSFTYIDLPQQRKIVHLSLSLVSCLVHRYCTYCTCHDSSMRACARHQLCMHNPSITVYVYTG